MALIKINTRSIPDDAVTPAKVSQNLGRRNILINGAMQVAQRGTSFTQTTGQLYTTDRFIATVGSSFNMDTTITQDNTVPTGEGFTNSLKVTPNSVVSPSGSDNGGIAQRLEIQDVDHLGWGTSSAKNITVSFWVRSSKTGVYCVQLQQNVSGSSTEVYSHVKEYTITAANTWQKVILTFAGNTAQAMVTGDKFGDGLRVNWWLACGTSDHNAADSWLQSGSYLATSNQVNFMDSTNNTWYMTGCQLEVGDTATPFEHRKFGEELQLCKRYYQYYPYSAEGTALGQANGTTMTVNRYHWAAQILPVAMRATPSITFESGSGTNLDNKARYLTTPSGQGGNDITPYGHNEYWEGWDGVSGSRNPGGFTTIVMKAYNEFNGFTCYGFQAGFAVNSEL